MDIEQQIQALKDALREVMQIVVQRGEPLSDDLKLKIAQVMEHVANRITQLRQEQQSEAPITPPIPEMQEGQYPSSNIDAFNYDYDNKRLLVRFHGNGPEKPVYAYEGVQPFIFDIFKRGAVPPKTSGRNRWHQWKKGVMPSLGAAMYHLIRSNYPYKKIA